MTIEHIARKIAHSVPATAPLLKSGYRASQRMLTRAGTIWPGMIRANTEKLTIAITAHCNLRCKGCNYGRDFMPDAPPNLATMHVGLQGTRRWFWQIRRALRAMDGLTAVSHDMARSYSRLAGRPVSLVANGVDCGALGQIAQQWPSAGAPFRFAMLSRLAPIKRHGDAVSAAERLIAAGYALELHFAGEEQCRAQLTALANTRAWLKLAGHVDPAVFLQGKHGFVLPSRAEGTPLALLEAMAAGLPAIVSDLPSLRDMAGDGASYVPAFERHALAQAMQHLMSDAGHWAQLGRTARRRAQDFDMRVVAAKYQARYSHLAASPRAQPRGSGVG